MFRRMVYRFEDAEAEGLLFCQWGLDYVDVVSANCEAEDRGLVRGRQVRLNFHWRPVEAN
jgi:hypothetical protein